MSTWWFKDGQPDQQSDPGLEKKQRLREPWRDGPGSRRSVRRHRPVLSIVTPAHNEAANLPLLVEETILALRRLSLHLNPRRFEIVVIDDASTDDSRQVLKQLAAVHPELRFFTMARQRGQSTALFAGIRAARGDWVATIDADLQNDPADLVRLWEALPGHNVALGYRQTRADIWSKRFVALWANRIRNRILRQEIWDTGCALRIFPRKMALQLPTFDGAHRFIGPLLLREGCKVVQIPIVHRPRRHGRSHYNLWNRSLGVVLDLFGVVWLMKRSLRWEFVDIGEGEWGSRKAGNKGAHPADQRVVGSIKG